jgi:leucyl-tRNA synthetase
MFYVYRYGQTNCFVGATLDYGLFPANENEIYVCTYRAARNMAFQDIITPRDNPVKVASLKGSQIIGTKIKAPFSVNPEVYVLPMEGVLPSKVGPVFSTISSGIFIDVLLLGYRSRHICSIRLSR